MSDTSVAERRALRFNSVDEFMADIQALAAGPVRATGQWSAGQIVQHIADAINGSIDGFGVKASDEIRASAAAARDRLLQDGFPVGIRLQEEHNDLLPSSGADFAVAVRNLNAAAARISAEPYADEHPYLGPLTEEQWEQFHCRHAELHFSFLHRDDGEASGE